MNVGSAYVDVKADLRPLSKGLNTAHSRVRSAASGLARRLAIPLTIIGTAAAVAGVKLIKDSIKAASDLQETTSKFETVFKNQLQIAEGFAKQLREGYAMSTEEAKRHLSSMQDLLVPMGVASDKAAQLSFEVVKLAADLGSFNNLETGQVMADIQSALVGNYETMKKYGVVLNATIVQQKALDMGLAASKEELTAGMKAQAAYQLIVEGSTAAIGDMARTQDSYANQMKQLNANWQELLGILGDAFLPVATEVISALNEWLVLNEDLVRQKADEWANNLAKAAEWVKDNWDDIVETFKKVVRAIEWVINAVKKLYSFYDKLPDFLKTSLRPIGPHPALKLIGNFFSDDGSNARKLMPKNTGESTAPSGYPASQTGLSAQPNGGVTVNINNNMMSGDRLAARNTAKEVKRELDLLYQRD